MTYTPNGYGGPTSGELYMSYDPCGNMSLVTDSSGTPQVSYNYDRNTSGAIDTYNPNGVVNLFTTRGKQGNVTVPGFGDDWVTIPIQRPGQIGVITGGIFVDDTANGTGLSVTNPCGEVGMCGFWDDWNDFVDCMKAKGFSIWDILDLGVKIGIGIITGIGCGSCLAGIIGGSTVTAGILLAALAICAIPCKEFGEAIKDLIEDPIVQAAAECMAAIAAKKKKPQQSVQTILATFLDSTKKLKVKCSV
jgi:hypothetical protein